MVLGEDRSGNAERAIHLIAIARRVVTDGQRGLLYVLQTSRKRPKGSKAFTGPWPRVAARSKHLFAGIEQ